MPVYLLPSALLAATYRKSVNEEGTATVTFPWDSLTLSNDVQLFSDCQCTAYEFKLSPRISDVWTGWTSLLVAALHVR